MKRVVRNMVRRARSLRRRMTGAETCLWTVLRNSRLDTFKFRRQHPIGPYVVDFVCMVARVVIEADGPQHDEFAAQDAIRDAWLAHHGYQVIRFSNEAILHDIDSVTEQIHRAIVSRMPRNMCEYDQGQRNV